MNLRLTPAQNPKTLAFAWMNGFSTGASHGVIIEHEDEQLKAAWQDGYEFGGNTRAFARDECERKYSVRFGTIKTL